MKIVIKARRLLAEIDGMIDLGFVGEFLSDCPNGNAPELIKYLLEMIGTYDSETDEEG